MANAKFSYRLMVKLMVIQRVQESPAPENESAADPSSPKLADVKHMLVRACFSAPRFTRSGTPKKRASLANPTRPAACEGVASLVNSDYILIIYN